MDNYEKKVKENIKRNKKYLNEFKSWLNEKDLTEKTINKHFNNAEFYLNDYLNYYDVYSMEKGLDKLNSFLGDWFIRKCLYASKTSIKEMAASIKKFYQCMQENNHVSLENYKSLCREIRDNMEIWLESLEEYDDGTFFDFIL